MLGPLTNMANLLLIHPEIKEKIPQIVIMGGAPHGNPDYPAHVSFNLSSDPEALQVVLDSGIPILMCPSHMGRYKAHLEADFVDSLKDMGEVGKFFHTLYDGYWEPTAPTKRVTTNDSCALFALVYPKIFKFKSANVSVNVTDAPGRTKIDFVPNGKIRFIDDLDRNAFINLITTELEDLKSTKLNF
jgi:pyrimidine-specific ribonucleoside hydrolase